MLSVLFLFQLMTKNLFRIIELMDYSSQMLEIRSNTNNYFINISNKCSLLARKGSLDFCRNRNIFYALLTSSISFCEYSEVLNFKKQVNVTTKQIKPRK